MAKVKGGNKYQARLEGIRRAVEGAKTLQVGFMANAKYPDGKSVAMIAAINEFGAPSRGQPPRPFFRDMVRAKQGEWPNAISKLLKANNYDARKTLRMAGEAIKGQLQQSIRDFDRVPLAPSTIRRKGFDKQLIQEGHMINSVDFVVK